MDDLGWGDISRYCAIYDTPNFDRICDEGVCFDNFYSSYPEQCGMCGHCMHQFVAEGNGNIYPCDFYCTDEWLLGNINDSDFDTLAHSQVAERFLRESLEVDEKCKKCEFYGLCRGGGCKRMKNDRDYCEAYKAFYKSCLPLFRMFKS